MKTILAIAGAAVSAILIYNRARESNPTGTDAAVDNMFQSVATIMVIADVVWALLEALMYATRPRGTRGSPLRRRSFGQVAAEVDG